MFCFMKFMQDLHEKIIVLDAAFRVKIRAYLPSIVVICGT